MVDFKLLLATLFLFYSALSFSSESLLIRVNNNSEFDEYWFDLNQGNLIDASSGGIKKIGDRYIIGSQEYLVGLEKTSNFEKEVRVILDAKANFTIFSLDSSKTLVVSAGYNRNDPKFIISKFLGDKVVSEHSSIHEIQGISWIDEANCVALITRTFKSGKLPWQLLMELLGHGVHYDTFYLEIYTSDGELLFNKKIHENLKLGRGALILTTRKKTYNKSFNTDLLARRCALDKQPG